MERVSNISKKLASLPNLPGVYLFKNKSGGIIYVGKSGNLKNRVRSYFNQSASKLIVGRKEKMVPEIYAIETIRTDSEINALIKESEFIKKHKPKFNVLMRDSKNYLYVGFSREEFPKIILTHQPHLKTRNPKHEIRNKSKISNSKPQTINYIGPFTDSDAVRKTLRILRDIFPYCTCRQKHNIKCLNAHIGKCLGFCCLKKTANVSRAGDRKLGGQHRKRYLKNIRAIKKIISGGSKSAMKNFKKEIKSEIKKQNFERALEIKKQILNFENVLAHAKVITDKFETSPAIFKDVTPDFRLVGLDKNPSRIETYDISNIQGSEAVGSMIVFESQTDGNYRPNKNEYRRFKIKTVSGINDPAMVSEIISRRFENNWRTPQLIVVDGGKAQLNAAIKAVGRKKIKIISLAKRLEEIYIPDGKSPILAQSLGKNMKHLFQFMRDEAHRFAIGYHRKLVRKSLVNQT